jgi:hypothetical protein
VADIREHPSRQSPFVSVNAQSSRRIFVGCGRLKVSQGDADITEPSWTLWPSDCHLNLAKTGVKLKCLLKQYGESVLISFAVLLPYSCIPSHFNLLMFDIGGGARDAFVSCKTTRKELEMASRQERGRSRHDVKVSQTRTLGKTVVMEEDERKRMGGGGGREGGRAGGRAGGRERL